MIYTGFYTLPITYDIYIYIYIYIHTHVLWYCRYYILYSMYLDVSSHGALEVPRNHPTSKSRGAVAVKLWEPWPFIWNDFNGFQYWNIVPLRNHSGIAHSLCSDIFSNSSPMLKSNDIISFSIYGGFLKWGYLQIIHFNRIFHEINHPLWGSPNGGNPHMDSNSVFTSRPIAVRFF